MLANYGYQDGSGDYFITIDTDRCAQCEGKGCAAACPAGVLEIVEDDYGDVVAAVKETHRKKIKYSCAPCKPGTRYRGTPTHPAGGCPTPCGWVPRGGSEAGQAGGGGPSLPCQAACGAEAIRHSW